jgi:peptidyl-prolyl cis-trans isomerase SurA
MIAYLASHIPSRMTSELTTYSSKYFFSHDLRSLSDANAAHLIIVPHRLFGQWKQEIEQHNDAIAGVMMSGSGTSIFALKNKPYDYKKFYEFIMASSRGRLFGEKANAIKGVYTAFVEKSLTDFEENNLATENPEFRNLLKEYRDGIILFELTDKSVWTKASTDSAGLAEYFAGNKAKYQWGPSFEGRILRCGNEKDLTEMQTLLRNFPIDTVIERMNLNGALKVNVEEGKFEYEKLDKAALGVAEGQYSVIVKNNDGSGSVYCPTKIIKTTSQKVLADARGYVIADYQDYLEKKWIADMEAKYPVKINEAVLKAMVKK